MAAIADIIVKKADGTTNITYTAIAGSAGDKIPAAWRSETSATLRGNRDVVTLVTQDNGPKTARRATAKAVMPIARVVSSVETVEDRIVFDLSAIVPNNLTDSEIAEKVEQALNMFASAPFRAAFKSGFSPN